MGDKVRNLLIGLFVIAGILILVFSILFLKPRVGDGKEILYVRFTNINKITVGTYVTYAGRPVGEVVAIEEISHLRDQPTDTLGRYYVYQLVLAIDSSIKVYDTDKIALQTSGLLGEKAVAIIPQKPPRGVTPKLITNQPIYADSVDPIENTFYELSQLSDEVQGVVRDLREWIEDNEDKVAYAVEWFGEAMHQASLAIEDINEGEIMQNVGEAARGFASAMWQFDEALSQLHEKNTFANLGMTILNIQKATASIDIITDDIAHGRGSIGKIFKKDDFYLSLMAIMTKVDTLMNDINQYGLLFSNNKQWQRLRTQRASALSSLNSPKEFREYFNSEVDLINTAMSRLTTVLEQSEVSGYPLQTEAFKRDFAELLRKVEGLADQLKLFNQQLMEASLQGKAQ
jgi:phospholipid/cholesterol/gamma-HCH transport system substrate-binding protein